MLKFYDFNTMPRAIIFEGADCSGKTTTAKAMADHLLKNVVTLENQGKPLTWAGNVCEDETYLPKQYQPIRIYYVRNPGGSEKAESLRNLTRQKETDAWEQADLYLQCFEATMKHIDALNHRFGNNILYIVDRWYPSLEIYQFAHLANEPVSLRCAQLENLKRRLVEVQNFNFGSKVPNHLYVFQTSDEEFLKRKKAAQSADTSRSPDRFDSFKLDEQLRIVRSYRELFFSANAPLKVFPRAHYTSLKQQIRDFTTHFNL